MKKGRNSTYLYLLNIKNANSKLNTLTRVQNTSLQSKIISHFLFIKSQLIHCRKNHIPNKSNISNVSNNTTFLVLEYFSKKQMKYHLTKNVWNN